MPKGYQMPPVVVTYQAEGMVPMGVQYFLVTTPKGEAIFERSGDGSGTLFQTHWQDEQGDHFAGRVANSHGYEFVIPIDRKQPGRKFVYPTKTYFVQMKNGVKRPIPNNSAVSPVARLIPSLLNLETF